MTTKSPKPKPMTKEEQDDPEIWVKRHPSDWQCATYLLSKIEDLRIDDVSGGVHRRTPRPGLFGYVWCNEATSGEVAHSCRHGPCPHRIKVYVPKRGNEKHWKMIETRSI